MCWVFSPQGNHRKLFMWLHKSNFLLLKLAFFFCLQTPFKMFCIRKILRYPNVLIHCFIKHFVENKMQHLSYILTLKHLKRTGKRHFSWSHTEYKGELLKWSDWPINYIFKGENYISKLNNHKISMNFLKREDWSYIHSLLQLSLLAPRLKKPHLMVYWWKI